MKAAKAIVAVVDSMHLAFFGVLVFLFGVLVFNSVLALIVSIILVVIGILSDGEERKSTDLSYLFNDDIKNPDEKNREIKTKSVEYYSIRDASEDEEPRWTVELLQKMDWKRYEDLCSAYFSNIGFRSELTGLGADEGVDIYLYEHNMPNPTAIVQCKSWSNPVGVNLIREFVGVMTHKKVSKGYFMTASRFHQPAIDLQK